MTDRSSKLSHAWIGLLAAILFVAANLGSGKDSSTPSAASEKPAKKKELSKAIARIPDDLVAIADAQYAPLDDLAPGSREAQKSQGQAVQQLGLPLEVRTHEGGIVFRLIPPGTFTMGSPSSESDRDDDETQHQVTLTKAFYCGKFEVTQGQWERVMGTNPSNLRSAGQDAPVEQVSWDDCQAFLRKLCQIEGVPEGTYRVLTEAEWEYACRAGTLAPFCYGNDLAAGMVFLDGESRNSTWRVVSFRPNAWGLYDMHGNVWEWCQDWYGGYARGTLTDPLGPVMGVYRVLRGGIVVGNAGCRSALRGFGSPSDRPDTAGLRLARTTASCQAASEPTQVPTVEAREASAEAVKNAPVEVEQRLPPKVQEHRRLPDDITEVADARHASLDGLAPGSREAKELQRQAVQQLGLPLEVKTRKTGIVFRLVPPGMFTMGSPPSEPARDADELQHPVVLTKAFYCGKFEVTQAQWQQVMGTNPSDCRGAGDEAPVDSVCWDDCQAFVNKLCYVEGVPEGTYRLLTEGEWEYACRAGTTTPFCYGNDLDSGMANFHGSFPYGAGRKGQYLGTTVRVGSFRPNAWGLYDMHGNVWEWCQDCYLEYPSTQVADPGADLSAPSGRVYRGGGWMRAAINCRSANRVGGGEVGTGSIDLGLRIARTTASYPVVGLLPQREPGAAAEPMKTPAIRPQPVVPGKAAGLQAILSDLVAVTDAAYASLQGLAVGSQEAQDRQRRAVQEFRLPLEVCTQKTRIVFRLIPSGNFTMGSPQTERDHLARMFRRPFDHEIEHQVALTKPFYCGKFEVTQGQWQEVMGRNPSYFKNGGLDAPVEQVSWEDCQVFLKKLCQLEGVAEGTYRLLTEAEWEYACRAGSRTSFCYGNDLDSSKANFDGDTTFAVGRKGPFRRTTTRVGSFRPNAWGLYDMHGNVWEWCQDWYGNYPSGSATDPLGPPSGNVRVLRGGCWDDTDIDCRSSNCCGPNAPARRMVGVRLARSIPSAPQ